jgi:hypothetical protein
MSDKKLSANQYALFEESVRENIAKWTNEANDLLQKINEAKAALATLRELSGLAGNGHHPQVDEKLSVIVRIFQEAKQKWISTAYVREQYKNITTQELPKSTLRHYLKGRGPYQFEKRGETRTAKWKLIDASETN